MLTATSAIDYGTIQKISKGDQGIDFFTFIDIIEALDLDTIRFATYFYGITEAELKQYHLLFNSQGGKTLKTQ